MTIAEKYRYDDVYRKLYEYDAELQAYIYVCSNTENISKQKLIEEYEQECNDIFNRWSLSILTEY